MTPEEFDRIVEEALLSLPVEFRERIRNVAVFVEEEPAPEVLEEFGLEPDEELFGLFDGLALTEQSTDFSGGLLPEEPARVIIYKRPLERACQTRSELLQEIRDTVVHELGHYFGLSDDEMPA